MSFAASRLGKSLVWGLWQVRQAFPWSAAEWLDLAFANCVAIGAWHFMQSCGGVETRKALVSPP